MRRIASVEAEEPTNDRRLVAPYRELVLELTASPPLEWAITENFAVKVPTTPELMLAIELLEQRWEGMPE